jgi:hypothetical protein
MEALYFLAVNRICLLKLVAETVRCAHFLIGLFSLSFLGFVTWASSAYQWTGVEKEGGVGRSEEKTSLILAQKERWRDA